jgi:hypothetical protein
MSLAEIISELPNLTEAERRVVVAKLCEHATSMIEDTDRAQAAAFDCRQEPAVEYRAVDLRAGGIGEDEATEVRGRLSTFAEDWNRPEMAIYDEEPAR